MNHFNVSIFKSILRLVACVFLAGNFFLLAASILAAAEIFGIVEEFVDKRKEE